MPGPGFEPGSPALRTGAITTKPPRRSTGPSFVVIAPARRAGDPGSIPGPGENFSLKLLIYDLSEGYSKAKISS